MGGRSTRTASARDEVRDRILSLPRRFRSDSANGLTADWLLRVGSQEYLVSVGDHRCTVSEGPHPSAATEVTTDPETWLAMDRGRLTGGEAFLDGRLTMRGNIDLAVRLQTLFEPFGRRRRPADLDQVEVGVGGVRLSTYTMGAGPAVLLLHGLGATKISWLPVLSALARGHRLIVPDLPGHGESDKPKSDYTPRFHAHAIRRLMDELEVERAAVVGNSLGGRVALELALRSPGRVSRLALLDPSIPGLRWRYVMGLARVVPSEVGAVPFLVRERWVELMIRRLFANPGAVSPDACGLAAVEFIRINRDPGARMAFLSSLRHIITERPDVFFATMRRIKQPTLVVFGDADRLIPPKLGARLAQHLPDSRLVVLPDVGHVPQFEAPAQTLDALQAFLDEGRASIGANGPRRGPRSTQAPRPPAASSNAR
jgi:pimeloyl-ACP methyl ester carboxylesterase/putative sterol carrier protein